MKKFLLVAASLSAVILSGPAPAQPPSSEAGIRVKYSDLDLRSEAGRKTLLARLDSAAAKVCRPLPVSGLDEMLERARCERETKADVRQAADVVIARANGESNGAAFAAR